MKRGWERQSAKAKSQPKAWKTKKAKKEEDIRACLRFKFQDESKCIFALKMINKRNNEEHAKSSDLAAINRLDHQTFDYHIYFRMFFLQSFLGPTFMDFVGVLHAQTFKSIAIKYVLLFHSFISSLFVSLSPFVCGWVCGWVFNLCESLLVVTTVILLCLNQRVCMLEIQLKSSLPLKGPLDSKRFI